MRGGAVRFVSVLAQRPHDAVNAHAIPVRGPWLVKILKRRNRFVIGMYRRHMKVIGFLGAGPALRSQRPLATGMIAAIARVLRNDPLIDQQPIAIRTRP